MFRYREAGEYGRGYDIPPDFQLTNLKVHLQNLGKVVKTSKRSYHWSFEVRNPSEDSTEGNPWESVCVVLTDSSFSKKKSLDVNGKRIIDKEKM